MQETARVNYVHYGKGSKKERANQDPVAAVAAVNAGKPSGKGKKVPLPTNICWRCGKGRHHKGHPCNAVEAVCRNCGTKGHYEKVCMKKSTHLVNVPGTSTDSDPDYFSEHGDPICAHTHMVHVMEINQKKHLIQFPIGTDFKKVRNSVDTFKCPTVLLKADTGADVNLMNSIMFDKVIGDRTVLQPTSLRMEGYGNNTEFQVLGTFHAFLRWKAMYTGNYFMLQMPMHHQIYSQGTVATHWEC